MELTVEAVLRLIKAMGAKCRLDVNLYYLDALYGFGSRTAGRCATAFMFLQKRSRMPAFCKPFQVFKADFAILVGT